jgi:hypothetical protein
MKLGTPTRWLFTLASLSIASTVSAADVRVMISAGFYGVYSELSLAQLSSARATALSPRVAHRWATLRRRFLPDSRGVRPQTS